MVSEDPGQRAVIGRELWRGGPEEFLASGEADAPHPEKQSILLSDGLDAPNGASMVLLADGKWRPEALQFERALLLFDAAATEAARALWRELDGAEQVTREIHKQDENGRWRLPAPFRSSSLMPRAATLPVRLPRCWKRPVFVSSLQSAST